MNKPFPIRLTRQTVLRSSTLERQDIGKWVFMVNGAMHGFCNTKAEAQQMIDEIFDNRKEALPRGKQETHSLSDHPTG
jgi:hypothetical protein